MRKVKNGSGFMITIAMLAAMAACSITGSSHRTAKQMFVLQGIPATTGHPAAADRSGCSLRISTPASGGGLNTTRMVYSTEPNRLDYFSYHEWVAPPAKMIASLMETRLDAEGLFHFVISGAPDITTDLRLDSHLQTLQQDFRADVSSVNLSLKVSLVEVRSRNLIDSKGFSYRKTAKSADPEAGVAAANLAVEQFVVELSEFLETSITKATCSDAH